MHKIAKCNKYDTFINFIKHKYKFMLYRALSLSELGSDPPVGSDQESGCGTGRIYGKEESGRK